ncbi:ComEA family DNA-binding protein [Micromonospora sp. NPDC049679]|uniref:ComEA family DNA-binding protein n=1 Tax=Micromonospora sp. NPDC049679 TaxID=3155920 RepID=UPI0033E63295
MPDDDEIAVRARLLRLTGRLAEIELPPVIRPPGPATPTRTPTGSGGAAPERPSGALPPAAAHPGTGDEHLPTPSRLSGQGAFDPGRRGIKALGVIAAVVVVGAGVVAWWSRPAVEPVPGAPAELTAAPPTASAPAASGGGEVVVAVAGRVRRPGLVRLPTGARVADVLDAAGGALPGTDVALLNLARKVSDGELIMVGVTPPPGVGAPPGIAPGAGGPEGAAPAPGAPGGGKINLNTATLAQLDALPGVGPVLAQRILDHRQRRGSFRSVGDLRQVDGIGDARFEQLRELVTV